MPEDGFAFEVHDAFARLGELQDFAEDLALVARAVDPRRPSAKDESDFAHGQCSEDRGPPRSPVCGFHKPDHERRGDESRHGIKGEVILARQQRPKAVQRDVI